MKHENRKFCFALALSVGAFAACAKKKDKKSDTADPDTTMVGDIQLNEEGISANVSDSLEALSDSHSTDASSSFALAAGDTTNTSTYTRSCAVDGNNAVVSVTATIDRTRTVTGKVRTATLAVTGKEDLTRTWSKKVNGTAVAVACGPAKKYANIDWGSDLKGLALAVDLTRSRTAKVSITNTAKGTTATGTRTFSATGTRSITWDAQATSTASQVTRDQTIVSDVKRVHTRENSKGVSEELDLEVKTDDSAPLKVEVVRDATTLALVSQTIKSGTLIATQGDKGYAETTFDTVETDFSTTECHIQSGTVTTKMFDNGATDPSKSYELKIVDGTMTLTDLISGDTIDDFTMDGCDIKSFQE